MRPDDDRIVDILDGAQSITDRFRHHSLDSISKTPDAIKATFYDVIIIGEAMRELVGRKDKQGQKIKEDAPIVTANPEIPWEDWIGMRDIVTHQYFRAAPEIVWRDYEAGELEKLTICCRDWLDKRGV